MGKMEKRIKFLWMIGKLFVFAEKNGIALVCFEFFRSTGKQQKKFAKGLSLCDGIKNKSRHQRWRAMDLGVVKDGVIIWAYCEEYRLLGEFWESLGGVWGHRWFEKGLMNFDDIYHFQY